MSLVPKTADSSLCARVAVRVVRLCSAGGAHPPLRLRCSAIAQARGCIPADSLIAQHGSAWLHSSACLALQQPLCICLTTGRTPIAARVRSTGSCSRSERHLGPRPMQLSRKGLAQVSGGRSMHFTLRVPAGSVSQLGVLPCRRAPGCCAPRRPMRRPSPALRVWTRCKMLATFTAAAASGHVLCLTHGLPLSPSPRLFQAPMSRMEPDQLINDRYEAIEERLKVCVARCRCRQRRFRIYGAHPARSPTPPVDLQVVRKRLNRPLTFAEKVVDIAVLYCAGKQASCPRLHCSRPCPAHSSAASPAGGVRPPG